MTRFWEQNKGHSLQFVFISPKSLLSKNEQKSKTSQSDTNWSVFKELCSWYRQSKKRRERRWIKKVLQMEDTQEPFFILLRPSFSIWRVAGIKYLDSGWDTQRNNKLTSEKGLLDNISHSPSWTFLVLRPYLNVRDYTWFLIEIYCGCNGDDGRDERVRLENLSFD